MALFEWTEKFMTGIGDIDEQHKKLVDMVNELHQAMNERRGKETLGPILVRLEDYTKYHFSFEEKELERVAYPALDSHRANHRGFERKIAEVRDKLAKNQIGLSVEVMDFLVDWLQSHILGEDMKYVPSLKASPGR